MSSPASLGRIRFHQGLYGLALAAVALGEGRMLEGAAGVAAQAAGFLLVVGAVLGRLWTTLFIAGRKSESLVQDGPYARCRHPLYLASVVAALGIGLTARSVALALALPAAVGLAAAIAARREDAALAAAHGEAWRRYRERVPAAWPRGPRSAAPAEVSVPLAIYRKAFVDAASFLGLWLLVLLADGLRAGGAWLALFRLP